MFNILATSTSIPATWFRQILFSINETIYKFIADVYGFILQLSDQSNMIIEMTDIGKYTSKIYVFVGVIMLFRIGIVLLKYIADPDKVSDKKDGVGRNVVPRVITVLALLVLVPTIFTYLYKIQSAIFDSEFLTNFFKTTSTNNSSTSSSSNSSSTSNVEATDDYTFVTKKDTQPNTCTYYINPVTNGLVIAYPAGMGTVFSPENIVSLGTGPVYNKSPYNFKIDSIVVKQGTYETGTITFYSSSNKSLTITNEDISAWGWIKTSNERSFETIVNAENGCSSSFQILLPADLIGYEVLANSAGYSGAVYTSPIDETTNKDITIRINTGSDNFYLGGAKSPDLTFPYNMTATPENLAILKSSPISTTDQANGTRFADVIMFGFIAPNSTLATADDSLSKDYYTDYIAQKELLTDKNNPYKKSEEQLSYAVMADLITKRVGDFYAFEYSGFIAFIAGIAILVMLIATVFQAALRIFKLIALELIAPIPIVMYLDPANHKAGDTSLEKWFKEVVKTFFDLFIRILIISFVSSLILDVSAYLGDDLPLMQKLFIIVGGLMFMNVGPGFILGLFGVKYEKGGFNPFTQMQQVAGLGVASGIVGGGVKGLTQGGPKALLSGMALGASATIGNDKAKGISGWGAGRDAMGEALAHGPGVKGGMFERAFQRSASESLRSKGNQAYDAANEHRSTAFKNTKQAFEDADTNYNAAVSQLSKWESTRDGLTSQMEAFQQTGDMTSANNVANLISQANNQIVTEKQNVNIAAQQRVTAVANHNVQVKVQNKLINEYSAQVGNVNKKTGDDATGYGADKGKDIKRADEVK